ncbi:MAG TPA: TRAM domain-containing protein, partial [Candidatus Methylomirabilis sp.]|nr:TRAM domain-containing protein [Candidatus Methylomirabilis sp.]
MRATKPGPVPSPAPADVALTVDRLVFRGDALGRGEDGRAVFVPFAAPGEVVRIQIVEERQDYRRGQLLELVTPSSDRRAAPCAHFTVCGGCQWLHLAEGAQRHWKERILREHLQRGARIAGAPVRPLRVPAPPLGYQWRAQFSVARVKDRFHLGYRRATSRQVEDLEACPLLAPPLNRVLAGLRALGPELLRAFPGLREVHLQGSEATGQLLCSFLLPPGGRVPPLRPLFESLAAAAPGLVGLSVQEETAEGRRRRARLGEDAVTEQVGEARLRISAGAPFPVSGAAATALAAEVLALAEPAETERVLDLCC